MYKIDIDYIDGIWAGKVINGWNIEHQVEHYDRERCLHMLLELIGIDVVIKGRIVVNGMPASDPQEWYITKV